MLRITILFGVLFLSFFLRSQDDPFGKKDFGMPVDIPVYLSGTFGELRGNHFHTGIDIKTQGTVGKRILAIEDGWVSRIKVSTSGYGKAIYVNHPDGYMSVYGHLSRFNDTIQKIVVSEQYEKESFTLQMFFDKGEIPVKKGELIAYSGNTGGSMGPHLHFEIRDLKTQNPLNPLLFESIKVKDFYRPRIKMLAIYPVDENTLINGKNDTAFIEVAGWGSEHRLNNSNPITISGRVSLGISAYDLMNDVPNKNGVFSTKLFHDSVLVFDLEMTRLSFKTGRYINSLIDYPYYKKSKTRLVRTQIDTNNRLGSYNFVSDNGIITFSDTLKHTLKYIITDAYQNIASLEFIIQSSIDSKTPKTVKSGKNYFYYHQKNILKENGFTAIFPSNTFYQSFQFDFQTINPDSLALSPTWKLHNRFIPAHKYFTIKIPSGHLSDSILKYSYVAYSADNDEFFFSGKNLEENTHIIKSRNLGYYKIMTDTLAPLIKPVNFGDTKKLSSKASLLVKIEDKETGIDNYRATLNGKWILMEYEPKKQLLIYNFDEFLLTGTNTFKLVVTDLVGNSSLYECEVVY